MRMAGFCVPRLRGPASLVALLTVATAASAFAQAALPIAEIDRVMEAFRADAHVPGMVWGVVQDGRLVHVKGAGIQDTEAKRAVSPETLFRIASMTKAFTALSILKLRDEGKLSLDAPVETYVPELKGWKYPTDDSPKIRVRDLLTHTAGFVTDDPWGDRQTPMPEDEFTRLLKDGVPFTRVAGPGDGVLELRLRAPRPHHRQRLATALQGLRSWRDLHAARHGVDGLRRRRRRRRIGARSVIAGKTRPGSSSRRWRTARSARWAASRPAPPTTPSGSPSCCRRGRRATAPTPGRCGDRACASCPPAPTSAALRPRPGATGAEACRQASTYAMGFIAAVDCDLGLTMSHGGGYPGYGSHVLLLPDFGVGLFAFANRTYAGPRPPLWDAALAMHRAGLLTRRPIPVSPALSAAYAAVGKIVAAGSITAGGDVLAMNMPMDRDAEHWARDLAALKTGVGTCETSAPITPTGALAGRFMWTCERGRVRGSLLLAPTREPRIQTLDLSRATP